MSKLWLRSTSAGQIGLNITAFNSPIYGQMSEAQTRTMRQYFPIKAHQPEIQFDAVFASEKEWEDFQKFVRRNQVNAQSNTLSPGVTLWWPEQDIMNWTGVIKSVQAGGSRANYTPRARFVVDLVDSLVSQRTMVSSIASSINALYGQEQPGVLFALPGDSNNPGNAQNPPASAQGSIGAPTDNLIGPSL